MRNSFLAALFSAVPDLPPEAAEKMADYYAALAEMNEKINLTAVKTPEDSAKKHFADSLAALPYLPEGAHVIDIGSGGGFPGVPLKIMRGDIKMTLLDSAAKKMTAVQKLCEAASVDVSSAAMRAEDAGRSPAYRGQYDAAVSRAVASLPVLLELCVPLVRTGGVFIAFKMADAEDIKNTSAAKTLGCCLEKTQVYGSKALLVFRKTEKTSKEYPRPFAKIKKQPL